MPNLETLEADAGSARDPAVAALRVRAGRTDLTPDRPLHLAGFAGRDVSEGVSDPVEAAALLFQDASSGRRCVIVTLDLLFAGPDIVECMTTHLGDRYGIAERDVMILASHTHFAPASDRTKPLLGEVDEAWLASCRTKLRAMLDGLFETPAQPACARLGSASWNGQVYRRRKWRLPYYARGRIVLGEPVMAPDETVEIERRISVWSLTTPDGAPVAAIWTTSCHPTGFPQAANVSADFVGRVRRRLTSEMGADVPVLFMQGFCGDVRPRVPDNRPLLRRLRDSLLFGPDFASFSLDGWTAWCGELSGAAASALQASGPATPLGGILKSAVCDVPRPDVIEHGHSTGSPIRFQRLVIGNLIDICALAAEPSDELRKLIPHGNSVPVGYLGDCFGYWPSSRQCREGGYEARGFFPAFSLTGALTSRLDDIFANAMKRLSGPD